jgi:DNA-binding ferritin-like protein
MAPLYDEPFVVAVPKAHPLAKRKSIGAEELKRETMLLLGTGHCFRDHVLEVCPEFARFSSDAEGIRKSFEGSSLETIRHMVASGMGITVVPQLSVPPEPAAAPGALHPVRQAGAHAPRGAGLAPHLHPLRGHRGAAQCGVCLTSASATKDRAAIAQGLSRLLADTYTLYLTTHNFHWNVTGPMFNTLHTMFMAQYTELWNAVDPIAERIRSLGHVAPGSYAEFGKLSRVPDAPAKPPKALEMVRVLVEGPRGRGAHRAQPVPAGRQGQRRAHGRPADPAPGRCTSRPPGCCARCWRSPRCAAAAPSPSFPTPTRARPR